jgi:hypothetical protein
LILPQNAQQCAQVLLFCCARGADYDKSLNTVPELRFCVVKVLCLYPLLCTFAQKTQQVPILFGCCLDDLYPTGLGDTMPLSKDIKSYAQTIQSAQ